jgi:hypothetical protein
MPKRANKNKRIKSEYINLSEFLLLDIKSKNISRKYAVLPTVI